MEAFEKELTELINRHSIENEADMPDFLLAGMLCRMIEAMGPSIKKTLDWHGCDSVCHPSPNEPRTEPFGSGAVRGCEEPVCFWAKDTGNFWLSNFYPAPIEVDGVTWPTSEHYYQAMKVPSGPGREMIRTAQSPKRAKEIAHRLLPEQVDLPVRAGLMRDAISHKFGQHPELAAKLCATRGQIVEASPVDFVWGTGPNGSGLNLMGLLLMELREKLNAAAHQEHCLDAPKNERMRRRILGESFRSQDNAEDDRTDEGFGGVGGCEEESK